MVILITFGRSGYLRRAMESGAVGFLLKEAPATELAMALRRMVAGERVVDPELALAALSEGDNLLSGREREVLAAALAVPASWSLPYSCHCPRELSAIISLRLFKNWVWATGWKQHDSLNRRAGCRTGHMCHAGSGSIQQMVLVGNAQGEIDSTRG